MDNKDFNRDKLLNDILRETAAPKNAPAAPRQSAPTPEQPEPTPQPAAPEAAPPDNIFD